MRVHHIAGLLVLGASLTSICWAIGPAGGDQGADNLAVEHSIQILPSAQEQLRDRVKAAIAGLTGQVQQRWGPDDTRTADKTTYVKYTQHYESRVITDFERGTLTVETVDAVDPRARLETAIVAALLTPDDPAAVELFSAKDTPVADTRRPYLYQLLQDQRGRFIETPSQAQKFARYLVRERLQTRAVTLTDQTSRPCRFVMVPLVKDFEKQGARRYQPSIDQYAAKWHVSPTLVLAIMRTESRFNPFAIGPAPSYGLMQLAPSLALRDAYKHVSGVDGFPAPQILSAPEHSIELGAAHLAELDTVFTAIGNQDSRDLCVIAAYNTGSRRVAQTFNPDFKTALAEIDRLDARTVYERLRTALPLAETRQYLVAVTDYRRQLAGVAETP